MHSARIELGQKTDPGRDPDKQVNEDSLGVVETRLGTLCVVCDGMGGHAGGQEASRLALQTIVDHVTSAPDEASPGATLREAVRIANARVHAMATAEKGGRPGSTAVAILAHKGGTEIAHVGDSRCYLVQRGTITQVTKDHSKVQLLVDAGYLRPEEAKNHPDANQIIRALGMTPDVDVELRPEPVMHVAGDAFVLCSDGLSDLVEPEEVLQAVSGASAQQAAGQLVDLANARGGHDNITVLVARLKESAVPSSRLEIPTVAATAPGTEVMATAPATTPTPTPTQPVVAPPAAAPSKPRVAKTEVETPLLAMGQPPPAAAGAPAVIPPGPPPASVPPPRSGPSILVVIGLVLAVVGLGVLGVVLVSTLRAKGQHHTPVLVPSITGPASTESLVADEEGGVPAPLATSADPLPAPPTASHHGRRRHRDAGGAALPELPPPAPSVTP
jgi:protein phosphatase